ncbi:MAG TPA: ABC transporter permease subunit, partial [Spirochaetota bacterium]|nr:ABC transporter permease subunit [Spirochaetota bacterium]
MEFNLANILQKSFERGIKYLVPVLVNTILWIVTLWIPYLNVGTTIGLMVGIITKMARDEEVAMTEIFKPEYRKFMGEYFLVMGFIMAGVMAGMIFLYMPGIVIAAVWKDCGYFALILLAALKAIDRTYYEAADIDGAGFWRKLFSITLPLISPTMFLLMVMLIIGSLQVFDSVFIMTGGGPAGATTIFM